MPDPLTENDIIAARFRAAESGVPWDRADAVKKAMAVAAEKRAARQAEQAALRAEREAAALSQRQRRNRLMLASLGLLLTALAVLGWLLTRR